MPGQGASLVLGGEPEQPDAVLVQVGARLGRHHPRGGAVQDADQQPGQVGGGGPGAHPGRLPRLRQPRRAGHARRGASRRAAGGQVARVVDHDRLRHPQRVQHPSAHQVRVLAALRGRQGVAEHRRAVVGVQRVPAARHAVIARPCQQGLRRAGVGVHAVGDQERPGQVGRGHDEPRQPRAVGGQLLERGGAGGGQRRAGEQVSDRGVQVDLTGVDKVAQQVPGQRLHHRAGLERRGPGDGCAVVPGEPGGAGGHGPAAVTVGPDHGHGQPVEAFAADGLGRAVDQGRIPAAGGVQPGRSRRQDERGDDGEQGGGHQGRQHEDRSTLHLVHAPITTSRGTTRSAGTSWCPRPVCLTHPDATSWRRWW